MKKVLTIQDISCVGQCSLTVALPVISAMGIETCILPSAVLSTHTSGFTGFTFRDLTEDLPAIREHWIKENIKFDLFYTGYIGSVRQLSYIADIIDTCRKSNSQVIIDPVMADHGKLYPGFSEDFVAGMAKLIEKADVVVPNLTEAALLTGTEYLHGGYSKADIEGLIAQIQILGAKKVVLTGVSFEKDSLGVAVADEGGIEYYFRERIPKDFHGTGDVYASSFAGAMALGLGIRESARLAVDFTIEAIKHTVEDADHWYGVKFEKALPYLITRVNMK